MATPKYDLRIIIGTESQTYDADYVVFNAHVCYVNESTDRSYPAGAILNPTRSRWDNDGIGHLADLTIRAQRTNGDANGQFYGFDLAYQSLYRVELRDLEMMVKGLRVVTRKLDKLAEKFGRPDDLATFCTHVADAIGCTDARPFGQYRREPWVTGKNYRWGDAESLRAWIEKM